jgi:hypothetical protein
MEQDVPSYPRDIRLLGSRAEVPHAGYGSDSVEELHGWRLKGGALPNPSFYALIAAGWQSK